MAFIQIPPPPSGPSFPPGLPIDNGILILFCLAVVYGLYKLKRKSKLYRSLK